MPDAQARKSLEDLAEEIFELTTLSSTVRSRSRRSMTGNRLTETEFLTLNALARHAPQTVGEIQKEIEVLPAQMSRIVRALEDKDDEALIECRINQHDRRRTDVTLTTAGRKAHEAYRQLRLGMTANLLRELSARDRDEFMRLLRLLREALAKQLKTG